MILYFIRGEKMSDNNREIHELLVDYAGALRDGCIPTFLKSLTRQEGQTIAASEQFWDAAKTVRVINSAGFGEKAITADVGLFASRVDVNIISRSKKARATSQNKRLRSITSSDDRRKLAKQKRSNRGTKPSPKR